MRSSHSIYTTNRSHWAAPTGAHNTNTHAGVALLTGPIYNGHQLETGRTSLQWKSAAARCFAQRTMLTIQFLRA